MFSTFLIGTLLATIAIMVALLAWPQPQPPRTRDRLPALGIALLLLLTLLAIIGGIAVVA